MTRKRKNDRISNLNKVIGSALVNFRPPEDINVEQWADKYRRLSPEASAEPGPWRTSRTPHLKRPMKLFTDPKVRNIVVVAPSQTAKSEFLLNCIGFVISQMPASIVFGQPNLKVAKRFSELRIAPMIRDTKILKKKVSSTRSDGGNQVLQKSYPGGKLILVGSESANDLCMIPAPYLFGDERERWVRNADGEGDPWSLAQARQVTFYYAKSVEASSPGVKGHSVIETAFYKGTQEYHSVMCPDCGEYNFIKFFRDIKFEFKSEKCGNSKQYTVNSIHYVCPHCGCINDEKTIKKQPIKYVAANPEAYNKGAVFFWFNPFLMPWLTWEKIILKFLNDKDDPLKLQVFYNTVLGELWEDRGEITDEETLLSRQEEYDAELPDGVLVLTMGVDTQDNRLEYEIVGNGYFDEDWGIKRGFIPGRPDSDEVWEKFDEIHDKVYRFANGRGLIILSTFVDSGGHYTQEVYKRCLQRQHKGVFAIKGRGGEGIPYINPPKQIPIKDNPRVKCWLYTIGVDAGKVAIMSALRVQKPGARYCHIPMGRGYDRSFASGILSEKLQLNKSTTGSKWVWVKLSEHRANEALDCRNYAKAAFKALDPDLERIEKELKGTEQKKKSAITKRKFRVKKNKKFEDDW